MCLNGYFEMFTGVGVYADDELVDVLATNVLKPDIDVFKTLAENQRHQPGTFMEGNAAVKYALLPVTGHKGTNNKMQVIYVEGSNGNLYIIDARDLSKVDFVPSLSAPTEQESELLLLIEFGSAVV